MKNNLGRTSISLLIFVVIIAMIILFAQTAHALTWSEIMFNPIGSDNNKEYVELLANDSLNDSLVGCSIYDAGSSDKLLLYHEGNDVIMIIENESLLLGGLVAQNNTIYMIGAAIGNGLGNTNESLKIVCGNQTLLQMSYDIHDANLKNFKEGDTIVYYDEEWVLGLQNGTPGIYEQYVGRNIGNNSGGLNNSNSSNSFNSSNSSQNISGNSSSGGQSGGGGCLESLHLLVSKTRAKAGDSVEITLLSPSFASVEAKDALGNTLLFKDTLEGSKFILLAPQKGPVQIVAHGFICNAQERMTRTVIIESENGANKNSTLNNPTLNNNSANYYLNYSLNKTIQNDAIKNDGLPDYKLKNIKLDDNATGGAGSVVNDSATQYVEQSSQGENSIPEESITSINKSSNSSNKITGSVIYDSNIGAVSWICAFGAITLIVCTIIFLQLHKSGEL